MNRTTLVVSLVFGAALGFAASCGGKAKDLCVERNVSCDSPLLCDPADAICKCGGRGGVVCGLGFVCDAVSNTCLSTKCANVDCSSKPGTLCDGYDGQCKCGGTGGQTCGDRELCDPSAKHCVTQLNCNQVACGKNQTCESTTGNCLCGTTQCAAGQFCSVGAGGAKSCVDNLCNGVTCTGSNVCDPADGYCKCNSAICQSGEACACPAAVDGGTCDYAQRSCRTGSACSGVTCNGGATCDPTDGRCKCGGPGGPACASNQLCVLTPTPQCQGGSQCVLPDGKPVLCGGGTSCDPEDGKCKCGGRGGQVCAPSTATDPGQVCVSNPLQQSCRKPCDVRTADCAMGTFCFFDSSAITPTAYCSAATDARLEDQACTSPAGCFTTGKSPPAMHCNGLSLGQAGICRPYCDAVAGAASCPQVPKAQLCIQISGAPNGFGFCQPQ